MRATLSVILVLGLSGLLHPQEIDAAQRDREEAEIIGTFLVLAIDDIDSGQSSLAYALQEEGSGRRITLVRLPTGAIDGLVTGARVRVRGHREAQAIVVGAIEPLQSLTDASLQAAAVTGNRKTITILVNMANATLGSNCTKSQLASELFTASDSMDRFYQEASFGQLTFPPDSTGDGQPDIFGPFLIPDNTADGQGLPPRFTWIQHAEEAAMAAGVDFSGYEHRIFIFPRAGDTPGQAPCTTAWGIIGPCQGFPCYVGACGLPPAIGPSCLGSFVFSHEIGHNFGMMHASVDANNDGNIDVTENGLEEYGDGSDVMGDGHCGWRDGLFHPNGPHKSQLGWFDVFPGATIAISSSDLGAGPVTRWISAIEPNPLSAGNPQLVELPGGYYLSTRQATGFDAGLDVDCQFDVFNPFTGRTSIHRFATDGYTLLTEMLDDGDSFVASGLQVTQLAHTPDSVLVQFGAPGLVFGDGFELGTLGAWSAEQP